MDVSKLPFDPYEFIKVVPGGTTSNLMRLNEAPRIADWGGYVSRATLLWQEAKFSRHAYYLLVQEYNVRQSRVRDGASASAQAEH